LGDREDDITYSLGWALGQSDDLVAALMAECFDEAHGAPTAIRLQDSVLDAGRTDIEVETELAHVVLEAKRDGTSRETASWSSTSLGPRSTRSSPPRACESPATARRSAPPPPASEQCGRPYAVSSGGNSV
jgi:hypothetical protein